MPRYVAFGTKNSPYVDVYTWSSGFGSRFSNPSTLPCDQNDGLAFFGANYVAQ